MITPEASSEPILDLLPFPIVVVFEAETAAEEFVLSCVTARHCIGRSSLISFVSVSSEVVIESNYSGCFER